MITVSSPDAERIARSFNALISVKGLQAIRRRAVNAVGSEVRKETRSLAGVVFGTSASALMVRGKAASPGSTDPAYRLRMARKIPVAKLKAKHRKISRGSGRTALVIDTPTDDAIRFRSVRREGARFILLAAGRAARAQRRRRFCERGRSVRAVSRIGGIEKARRKGPARGGCHGNQ